MMAQLYTTLTCASLFISDPLYYKGSHVYSVETPSRIMYVYIYHIPISVFQQCVFAYCMHVRID